MNIPFIQFNLNSTHDNYIIIELLKKGKSYFIGVSSDKMVRSREFEPKIDLNKIKYGIKIVNIL